MSPSYPWTDVSKTGHLVLLLVQSGACHWISGCGGQRASYPTTVWDLVSTTSTPNAWDVSIICCFFVFKWSGQSRWQITHKQFGLLQLTFTFIHFNMTNCEITSSFKCSQMNMVMLDSWKQLKLLQWWTNVKSIWTKLIFRICFVGKTCQAELPHRLHKTMILCIPSDIWQTLTSRHDI